MKRKYFLFASALFLSGCTFEPSIFVSTDPVLEKPYLNINGIYLIPNTAGFNAALELKKSIGNKSEPKSAKALLRITSTLKLDEYLNSNETLYLKIGNNIHELEIINSSKHLDTITHTHYGSTYITTTSYKQSDKSIAFELPIDLIKSIISAENGVFEIYADAHKKQLDLKLTIDKINFAKLKEFITKTNIN